MAIHSVSHKAPRNASSALKDMTQGEPFKLIILYSIPLLLGSLFQQMYSMVDTVIVGRMLGTNALAAVGNTGPMNFLVLGFVFGVSSGFAVITAQRFGAKDFKGLRCSVAMNIMLNIIVSVILTAIACFSALPILRLINTPEEVIGESFSYIIVIYIGIIATVTYNMASCILRAIGDSKSPVMFLIMSSILNIILDVVLIHFMGIAGAAWATVISQAVAGVASVVYMMKKYPIVRVTKKDFIWDNYFAIQHLKIGLNMAFQFSITAIGVVVLQGALNVFGAVKMAAYTAAQKVEQLVCVAAQTTGVTMANYAGQNFGAKQVARIKEGTNKACLISFAMSVLALVLAWSFQTQLIALFIDRNLSDFADVLAAAKEYLHITGVLYPFLFLLFIYRNVLQSIGKGFWPLMGGIFELVARTVAAFTLPALWGFGGICAAGPAAWIAACVPLAIAYYVTMRSFKIGE